MFFEEGWVPIAEATSEVFRQLQALQGKGRIEVGTDGLRAMLAVSVWDICDACSKIGVTGGDGVVVPASKDLVAWADPRNLSNEHINLVDGTVGSSTLTAAEGGGQDSAAMALRYGPFLNLPIVMPVNNYQSSLTFLEEEVTGQSDGAEAVDAAAGKIVAMVESGKLVTREIARTALGASLSRRRFKLAWAVASDRLPDLKTPNRWQGL